MRVVVDTNVLVSGIFFGGPPHRILKAWRDGRIELVVSEKIPAEYRRVAGRLALEFPEVDLAPFLDLLESHAMVVDEPPIPGCICDDPSDDKFIACAQAARACLVVSGDRHLLKVSGHEGVRVLTLRMFVDEFLDKS